MRSSCALFSNNGISICGQLLGNILEKIEFKELLNELERGKLVCSTIFVLG